MHFNMNALTHWMATNKEGERYILCCGSFNCSSGDIGFIKRRSNGNELSHFLCSFKGTWGQKNVELSTPDLDKELIIHLITLEKCLFTQVKRIASLIPHCGKKASCCSTILDWHPAGASAFTQEWVYLQTLLCYHGIEKFGLVSVTSSKSTIDRTCSRNKK